MPAARTTKMINDGAAHIWQRRARTAGAPCPSVLAHRRSSGRTHGPGAGKAVTPRSRPAVLTKGFATQVVPSGDLFKCPLDIVPAGARGGAGPGGAPPGRRLRSGWFGAY